MQVVWIYGPAGVGKSTTAWELYGQLEAAGVRAGYVDIDQLGMCYPARPEDPCREELKAANIGAVLRNFAAAGAELMIVSGILDPRLVPAYEAGAAGCRIAFFRLRASLEELRRRLEKRGRDTDSVDDILREADELDAMELGHVVMESDGLNPVQLARAVGEKLVIRPRFGDRPGEVPAGQSGTAVEGRLGGSGVHEPAQGRVSEAPGRLLWLSGPTAAGKSTVGYAIFQRVLQAGGTAAFADLEQLGFFLAGDDVDRGSHRLKATNIADLWSVFHSAGASCLIMVGAVDDAAGVRHYRDAFLAADLTLCRLLLPSATELADRIRRRANGEGPDIAGNRLINQPSEVLARAMKKSLASEAVLDRAAIGDFSLPTSGRTVAEIAQSVLDLTGLLLPGG